MKLATTYLLVSLAAGCGVGVDSTPGTLTAPETPPGGPSRGLCDAPEGPIHPFTLASEVETLIVGQWRHCSGAFLIDGSDAGIEFFDDHTLIALVDDGSGHLLRKTGFGNQGTWDASQEGATSVQFNYHLLPAGSDGGAVAFEDWPQRFSMYLSAKGRSIYVADRP